MLLWQIVVRDAKKLGLATDQDAAEGFLEEVTGTASEFKPDDWATWRKNLRALDLLANARATNDGRAISKPVRATVSRIFSQMRIDVSLPSIPGDRRLSDELPSQLDNAPSIFFTNRRGDRLVSGVGPREVGGVEYGEPDQQSFWQEVFFGFFDRDHPHNGRYCEGEGCFEKIEPTKTGRPSKQKKCGRCLTREWYYRDHEAKKKANAESQARRRRILKGRQK